MVRRDSLSVLRSQHGESAVHVACESILPFGYLSVSGDSITVNGGESSV